MSKFQKIVTELKNFLADIPTEVELAITQNDLVISEMVIGGKVEVKDTQGNVMPCPDGEYTVGTDVIVVKDGMIESLNGEVAEQMEEEIEAADTPNPVADLQAQVDAMAIEIETLKTSIEEMKTGMSAETEATTKFSSQLEELTNTIKLLMSMPAEFSKTNEAIVVKDSRDEKLLAAARLYAKVK